MSLSVQYDVVNVLDATGRIYIASPKPTFRTFRYDRMISHARTLFPRASLMKADGMFAGNEDWLSRWPEVLSKLVGLVFFAERDGTLGMGVCKEVNDAEALGLPVFFLDNTGAAHRQYVIQPHPVRTARHFAYVTPVDKKRSHAA